jgi:hypothetical protein
MLDNSGNYDNASGVYNNFYVQTYNWNLYSPVKIPGGYMDDGKNKELKLQKIYEKINL